MRRLLLLSSLLLVACHTGDAFNLPTKDIPVNPITEAKAKLAFTCAYEKIPDANAEADVLFQYARWLQKNNQLKQDKSVDAEIERLYRIATENGHYKANINLQNGSFRGHFQLKGEENLRLSQQLIEAGVATGYYFVAIFLQQGSAGLRKDPEMSLRFYRKAADQGNAQAQAYVGEKLAPIDIAPDIAQQMRRCAAEQRNNDAAADLGVNLQGKKQYKEALEAFQLGVAAGDSTSASFLSKGFLNPPPSNELHYLEQQEDLERADRYKKIWRILANYSYADPIVPEINEILPLPPAKLPEWDGKLQWLEARLANVQPPKPTEALIQQLAKAKILDPATGKPMPGSPGFVRLQAPLQSCHTGAACPQSGYWATSSYGSPEVVRRFKQGEIMPTADSWQFEPRIWPLSAKQVWKQGRVTWQLIGEV